MPKFPTVLGFRINISNVAINSTSDYPVTTFTYPVRAYSTFAAVWDAAIKKAYDIAGTEWEVKSWCNGKVVPLRDALANEDFIKSIEQHKVDNNTGFTFDNEYKYYRCNKIVLYVTSKGECMNDHSHIHNNKSKCTCAFHTITICTIRGC